MNTVIRLLSLLLCICVTLMGCSRTTTVILPPETTAYTPCTTTPHTEPSAKPTADPTMGPDSEPTTAPVSKPTAEPTVESTTEPTTVPTIAPTAEPTTATTTEQSTEPTTEPSTDPATHPVYDIDRHTVGSLEYGLLDAINQQRAAAEDPLPPLAMDHTLCALATIRACECSENFSHVRPDGRGAFTVLSDHGYDIWSRRSERIHYGSAGLSAGTIVKGWMYNSDFSANILSGEFTHLGIGVYNSGGTTYIVCFFAG